MMEPIQANLSEFRRVQIAANHPIRDAYRCASRSLATDRRQRIRTVSGSRSLCTSGCSRPANGAIPRWIGMFLTCFSSFHRFQFVAEVTSSSLQDDVGQLVSSRRVDLGDQRVAHNSEHTENPGRTGRSRSLSKVAHRLRPSLQSIDLQWIADELHAVHELRLW